MQMTMVQRIWGVILLEHSLFCIKIFIENLIKVMAREALLPFLASFAGSFHEIVCLRMVYPPESLTWCITD